MTYFTYGEIRAARPTGRRRYRRGWFGRMILQVEIKHPNASYPRAPRSAPYDPWRNGFFTFWRDANEFDVAAIEGASSEENAA